MKLKKLEKLLNLILDWMLNRATCPYCKQFYRVEMFRPTLYPLVCEMEDLDGVDRYTARLARAEAGACDKCIPTFEYEKEHRERGHRMLEQLKSAMPKDFDLKV